MAIAVPTARNPYGIPRSRMLSPRDFRLRAPSSFPGNLRSPPMPALGRGKAMSQEATLRALRQAVERAPATARIAGKLAGRVVGTASIPNLFARLALRAARLARSKQTWRNADKQAVHVEYPEMLGNHAFHPDHGDIWIASSNSQDVEFPSDIPLDFYVAPSPGLFGGVGKFQFHIDEGTIPATAGWFVKGPNFREEPSARARPRPVRRVPNGRTVREINVGPRGRTSASARDRRRPPPRRTNERKLKAARLGGIFGVFLEAGFEAAEIVDILADAAGLPGQLSIRRKAELLFTKGWIFRLDTDKATRGLVWNIIEDALIGKLMKGARGLAPHIGRGIAIGPAV